MLLLFRQDVCLLRTLFQSFFDILCKVGGMALIQMKGFRMHSQALITLKNLLLLRTTKAQVLRDFCGLDVALERMRMKLEVLMEEEDHRDYAMDVENLRSQVEFIFLEKLGKVVSTLRLIIVMVS